MTMMSRRVQGRPGDRFRRPRPVLGVHRVRPCRSAACAASTPSGLVSLLSKTVCGRVVDRMSSSQLSRRTPSATTAGCSPAGLQENGQEPYEPGKLDAVAFHLDDVFVVGAVEALGGAGDGEEVARSRSQLETHCRSRAASLGGISGEIEQEAPLPASRQLGENGGQRGGMAGGPRQRQNVLPSEIQGSGHGSVFAVLVRARFRSWAERVGLCGAAAPSRYATPDHVTV